VSIATLVLVGFMAAVMEVVDSGLGMMYGTLLSPALILMGFDPKMVIPSILISQGIGGAAGSIGHHKRRNCNFSGWTRDLKISLAIVVPGLIACIAGVFLAKTIPSMWMKTYIGVLVVVMGLLCLFPVYYTFTWKKMWGVGLLSGFNKAFSGGGFGPITSTAKILAGVDAKVSVGTTTLAEVPICLFSFALWLIMGNGIQWQFPLALCAGALVGGVLGPVVTQKMNTKTLRWVVGFLAVLSGTWLLIDLVLGLKLGQ
jgi:hypothetical protein